MSSIFEKEYELAGSKLEYNIRYGSLYMESDDDNSFTDILTKIKNSIIEFFKKIQKIIDDKITEFRRKKFMDELKKKYKNDINEIVTIKGYTDTDKLKRIAKKVIDVTIDTDAKITKIMLSNISEKDKYTRIRQEQQRFDDKMDALVVESDGLTRSLRMKCTENNVNKILANTFIKELEATTLIAINRISSKSADFRLAEHQKDKKAEKTLMKEARRITTNNTNKMTLTIKHLTDKQKFNITYAIAAIVTLSGVVMSGIYAQDRKLQKENQSQLDQLKALGTKIK